MEGVRWRETNGDRRMKRDGWRELDEERRMERVGWRDADGERSEMDGERWMERNRWREELREIALAFQDNTIEDKANKSKLTIVYDSYVNMVQLINNFTKKGMTSHCYRIAYTFG
ncbi:hypothetical protein L195_g053230, partial [Trifolium pratense]